MKALVPLLALLLTSCIVPYTHEVPTGENITARVIDVSTGKGVAGATIRYSTVGGYEVQSDASGQFTLQAKSMKKSYWLPPAPVNPPPWKWDAAKYAVVITAPGYEEASFERVKHHVIIPPRNFAGPSKGDPEYFVFSLTPRK